MNRVPPSGGPPKPAQISRPPSAGPGTKPSSAAPGKPIRRSSGGSKHVEKEKPKLKAGAEETEAPAETGKGQEGPGAAPDPHEHAKIVSEAWQPESHAEKAEEKEARDDLHEEEQLAKGEGGSSSAHGPKGFLKQIKPALKAPFSQPQQAKQQQKDGFEGQKGLAQALKTAQSQAAGPARPAAPVSAALPVQGAQPAAPAPRPSRPPDAFAVLHAAQDPGVFFREEGHHGAAEQADPELSAAIEEAIRLLFGVRGILRVSGGFNQADQPAIIVVATQGFGEASMKLVPAKVHRFETILAVPYEMLPLKRERL